MKEYITKDRAKQFVCGHCNEVCSEEPCEPSDCDWMAFIDKEPAADVVEVRHGRWEPTMTSKTVSFYLEPGWKCSCCGHEIEDKSEKLHYPKHLKYCWNCGAKMNKEE